MRHRRPSVAPLPLAAAGAASPVSTLEEIENRAAICRVTSGWKRASLPLEVVLLVDVSSSQEFTFDDEKRAASAFLQRVLRPKKDSAAVMKFGDDLYHVQGMTDRLVHIGQQAARMGHAGQQRKIGFRDAEGEVRAFRFAPGRDLLAVAPDDPADGAPRMHRPAQRAGETSG